MRNLSFDTQAKDAGLHLQDNDISACSIPGLHSKPGLNSLDRGCFVDQPQQLPYANRHSDVAATDPPGTVAVQDKGQEENHGDSDAPPESAGNQLTPEPVGHFLPKLIS